MVKQKSPFIGFTEAEVRRAEANSFVVILGNDLYSKDGNFVFSLTQAEKHYYILLKNILITLDEGNPKQRKSAMHCLGKLHIQPLRIQ
jgi:predicted Zn-dependent protease